MQQSTKKVEVLLGQGLIQPQTCSESCLGGLRGAAAEYRIHRVARSHPQQQEHQARDQPQHHRSQGKPRSRVAEQLSTSSHQRTSCSRASTT